MLISRLTPRTLTIALLKGLRVNKIAARIYYRYVHGFASAGKETPEAVRSCLEQSEREGWLANADYHEFGIFKGHTLLQAQKSIANLTTLEGCRCFGYDSFEGLPEPEGLDVEAGEPFYAGQFKCSYEDVVENLTNNGFDWSKGHLVRGYFDQSLTTALKKKHKMTRAAVILVDCDLYESSRNVFDFIDDIIGPGTILLLDDFEGFGKSKELGQKRSFFEFVEKHQDYAFNHLFNYGSYGSVFQVRAVDEK